MIAPVANCEQPLPSAWDREGPGFRKSVNARHLTVKDGLTVQYTGQAKDDSDAAAVRANHPVPTDCALYYFEVTVLNKGTKGFIGIGFQTADVDLDRLPGWSECSYAVHADDGLAFTSGSSRRYGPTFTTGDVIGAIFNRAERTISFTKNGIDLGVAFRDVQEERLYPTVGLRTTNEEVTANFGPNFQQDISAMHEDAAQRLLSDIDTTSLPKASKVGSLIGELVFNFLTHHGHWETAAVVARDMLGGAVQVSQADINEIRLRQQVCEHICAARLRAGMDLAEALAPGVLAAHPRLLMRLQCQTFMEMVKQRDDKAAVEYGRSVLSQHAQAGPEEQALLSQALGLLAYPDPTASPHAHLLGAAHRAGLAAELNSAMLAHTGRRERSALEQCYRQLKVVHQEMLGCGDVRPLLLDVEGRLLANLPESSGGS